MLAALCSEGSADVFAGASALAGGKTGAIAQRVSNVLLTKPEQELAEARM
jgi:hypothetical protein